MSNYEYTRMRLDGGWKLDKTFIVALLDELDRLQQASRWIPVSERLPEDTTYVLVKDRFAPVAIGWYDGKRWYDTRSEDIETEATHWKPLPTPPEGE